MALKHHVLRILGAAMILIALWLVPSIASAHSGHAHHAAAMNTHAAPAADDVRTSATAEATDSELRTGLEQNAPSEIPPCTGGCCSGAPCTFCAAVILTDDPAEALLPPRISLELPDPAAVWQLHPDAPRKPPRFFA